MKGRLLVFSGNSNKELARKVCDYLTIPLAACQINRFPDGEIDVKVGEDVRGADIFVVQSTCPPVNENIMELLILIDCFRRASADRITAVIPYYGYARQDRKAEGRVPITAKLVANMISAGGANRVLSMDLHAAQIQGFFDIPMDHLFASPVLVDYIKRLDLQNLMIVSPDIGGVKMARAYAKRLGVEIAIVDKRRMGAEETEVMHIVGNVEGRNVILLDDIISTGTSIANAAKVCRERGAKSVYIMATHAIFAKNCVDKLAASGAKEVIVTDTVPVPEEKRKALPNLKILTIANLLGETINRIHRAESVSQLFV
jgi:ribose-phosphate pyrophosphokinase